MTAILEIDLAAIAQNWLRLDAMHAGATAGVIKADAYGLGAAQVAPRLYAAGCRHFFVAQLDEALAVRAMLPGAMVAVLNGILAGQEAAFADAGITPVLGSLREVALWRAQALHRERELGALLHVDTGMSRLGFDAGEVAALRDDPGLLAGLRVDYVMTHLVSADTPEDPFNAEQARRFARAAAAFPRARRSFANSSGMFLGETFASDLARPGAAVYGVATVPADHADTLRDVVRLSAPILQVRDLQAGETVGYNGFWTAARPSRIAVVGVGYADGLHRALSNRGTARFDGTPVPLVGRVSMDLTTFDVTDVAAAAGDWLELIGPGHGAAALAIEAGTNGYEILTSLGRRYQRRYLGA
jgi:alanine racemase